MGYELGIDLGTTFTAAAVARDGHVEIVSLGDRAASIPSVVFVRDDDQILTGDAANRRATSEPGRVAREFKRRVGDPTPLVVGATPMSAESLMSRLLRWTRDKVAEIEGSPPDHIAVTYPANWGPYKKDLLSQAIHMADLGDAKILTEPEAAASFYASTERVELGSLVAVYDFGGGTFDAAILRKTAAGFQILGKPEGVERLGGIDLDEAVFEHVSRALGGALNQLDPDDPNAVAAVARLRQECTEAKEALSTDTDTSIPVMLPNLQTEVRLTRSEFEDMIRLPISETIAALRRALASAGVEPRELKTVLLVGGSSRIPLVGEMVSADLGLPVAVDVHPKHAVALGAALAAAPVAQAAPPTATPTATPVPTSLAAAANPMAAMATAPVPALVSPTPPAPPSPPARSSRGKIVLLVVLTLILLAIIGANAVILTRRASVVDSTATQAPLSPSLPTPPSPTPHPRKSAMPSVDPPASVVPPSTHTHAPQPDDSAAIKDISYSGNTIVVHYKTHHYNELLPGQHVHFFFDTVAPRDAGVPAPSSNWYVYGGPDPFTEATVTDIPVGATMMCILVANPDHSVIQDTGNCVALPPVI